MLKQITDFPGNNQLLYFTSPSLARGGKQVCYIGDRTGHPNLYTLNLETGEERQLTFQSEGMLRSYVYFDGQPFRGFGKASVSLDVAGGLLYYLQGQEVRRVSLEGEGETICRLPGGVVTGFTHLSADGRLLCVPTIDQAAFDVPQPFQENIDRRVREENLCSTLRVFDTATGEEVLAEPVPGGWVTHVQFSPTGNSKILYNHEWALHSGIRRLWLFDGKQHIRLRPEGEGRSRDDWACHEMWEKDGRHVIYHGGYRDNGPSFVGRVDTETGEIREIAIDPEFRAYGHFTTGESGMLVSDGYYRQPDDEEGWAGRWISLQRLNWEACTMEWIPLCRHGSSWDCQCSHPHPVFGPGDREVWFTSDRSGRRQVWRVDTGL